MTWYKITYRNGTTEFLNDDDPVNKNKIRMLREEMGGLEGTHATHVQTPAKIETSSESAARKAAGR